jgi:gas vesicle protein
MTTLSTVVAGDPAECRAAAALLRRTAGDACEAADRARSADPSSGGSWVGPARQAFEVQRTRSVTALEDLASRARRLARSIYDFADALESVSALMEQARSEAVAAGAPVTPSAIEVTFLPLAMTDATSRACAAVDAARQREGAAHAALRAALDASRGESLLENFLEKTGFMAPDNPDTADRLKQVYRLTSAGADFVATSKLARLELLSPAAAQASRWRHVGAVTGPAGRALAVGFSAKHQWRADADDPNLSTADRVGRTAVRGVVEGGTAIAGGITGGQIGGSIGTMICPGIGTAVGGVVGGVAGAFATTKLGKSTADAAVEAVDDVIDVAEDVGEAIGEAAGAVVDAGDAALDAADDVKDAAVDKAKDVGKKLCFWD